MTVLLGTMGDVALQISCAVTDARFWAFAVIATAESKRIGAVVQGKELPVDTIQITTPLLMTALVSDATFAAQWQVMIFDSIQLDLNV